MDIRTAHDICHRSFQDRTLDLADEMIGAQRVREAAQEDAAGADQNFRDASYVLETAAINLRAYSRGMVSKQALPSYIKQAREALDRMEGAL